MAEQKERQWNISVDSRKTGAYLAGLRKRFGYTQTEAAERLHISNKAISKWESGKGLPEVTILPALAAFYGVTVDEILAGESMEESAKEGAQESRTEIPLHEGKNEDVGEKHFVIFELFLWILTIASLTVLGLMYHEDRRLTGMIAVICLAVVLLAAGGGVVFQYYERRKYICYGMAKVESALLFWRRMMALLLPLLLAGSCAAAYLTIEQWRVPAPLPSPYIDNLPEDSVQVSLLAATEFLQGEVEGEKVELAPQIMPVGLERLKLCLPALLAVMLLWGMANLGGRLWLLRRSGSRPPRSLLGAIGLLAACGLIFAAASGLWGRKYEQDRSVETEVFAERQEYDKFLNGYFQLYNSYRYYAGRHGEQWPEIYENTAVIDSRCLDESLSYQEEYVKYHRVIGLDADSLTVWRAATTVERIRNRLRWILAVSAVAGAALVIFCGCWLLWLRRLGSRMLYFSL